MPVITSAFSVNWPSALVIWCIMLFFLLWVSQLWKNLVLRSPSLSHFYLALCFHFVSSSSSRHVISFWSCLISLFNYPSSTSCYMLSDSDFEFISLPLSLCIFLLHCWSLLWQLFRPLVAASILFKELVFAVHAFGIRELHFAFSCQLTSNLNILSLLLKGFWFYR